MKKILLLDDSPDYGIILTLQMKPYKYEVVHYEEIDAALGALRSEDGFDFIFCDFYIGVRSAYDFIEACKELFKGKNWPALVILTNLPPDSPQLQALHDEGFSIYQKPTRSEQIGTLVRSLESSGSEQLGTTSRTSYFEPRT